MAEKKFWSPNTNNKKFKKLNNKKSRQSEDLNNSVEGLDNSVEGKGINKSKMKNKKSFGHAALKVSGGLIAVIVIVAALGFFFIVRPATKVFSKVQALRADSKMVSEGFLNRDLVEVSTGLDKMEVDLEELRIARDENLKWMSKIPLTRPYYEDTDNFIDAGEHMIAAGREAVVLSEPFADAVGLRVSEDEEGVVDQSLMDAFSSWISVMPKIAENSDEIIFRLSQAGEELKKVDASRYPKKVRGMEVRANIKRAQNVLTELNRAAPDVKKALTLIPTLLGTDGSEIRYLVIMQNDKEIRPTGGFWTNYATFKVKNAMLVSDFTSRDMYSIDLALESIDAYYDFPDAPDPYTKYLKVEHLFARDTNTSPDFPTSIDNFMEFYDMAGQVVPAQIKPVSGTFALDTHAVGEFMEVTGPVTVNGVTYDSENVVLELEKIASLTLAEQAGRKRVLGFLMEAMLVNVFESDSSIWPQLIEKGIDLAVRKHILINLDNPEVQALVEKYNLGGTIKEPVNGDYAYVVSTNLGGDKTNWFVSKDVTHKLEEENGKWKKTVTIEYTYPRPEEKYAPFIKQFKDWVRVYVPSGSELISAEGIQDSFGGGSEKGKDYFDGFLTMQPEEIKTVTFQYYLPDGVVVAGEPYSLLIQKQPGIDSENHKVEVPGKTEEIELTKDYEFTADF